MKESSIFSGPLRELREMLDKTQPEMAELIGVSLRTYAYWEAGVHAPPARTLAKIQALASKGAVNRLNLARIFLDRRDELSASGMVSGKQQLDAGRSDSQIYRACSNLEIAVSILKDQARAGSRAAMQKLLDLADRATRLAGDQSTAGAKDEAAQKRAIPGVDIPGDRRRLIEARVRQAREAAQKLYDSGRLESLEVSGLIKSLASDILERSAVIERSLRADVSTKTTQFRMKNASSEPAIASSPRNESPSNNVKKSRS